jgi:Xaa-Pro aminopeptidase
MMMNITERIHNFQSKFAEHEIDAFLISKPENLYYLSGCPGLEGYLLITETDCIIVTDFRYVEHASQKSPDFKIFQIDGKMSDWLPSLMQGRSIRCLAFESSHLTYAAYQQFNSILNDLSISLKPVNGVVEKLRMVKEPGELDLICEAIKITDGALRHAEEIIRPGITEKQAAWELEKFMRENGSQSLAFDIIAASGRNAALPHALPSDKQIETGDMVIIDIGAKYKLYDADLTRTFFVGSPDEKFTEIYDIVLRAQLAAVSEIKSGMTGAEIDAAARSIIAQSGYADNFGHGLGHGFGLYVHELPSISSRSTDVISDGMVFTIEPGIYISGWGGVRIEDDVVIENGRARVISAANK